MHDYLFVLVQLNFLYALKQEAILVKQLKGSNSVGDSVPFLFVNDEFKNCVGLEGELRDGVPFDLVADCLVVVGQHELGLCRVQHLRPQGELNRNVEHVGNKV